MLRIKKLTIFIINGRWLKPFGVRTPLSMDYWSVQSLGRGRVRIVVLVISFLGIRLSIVSITFTLCQVRNIGVGLIRAVQSAKFWCSDVSCFISIRSSISLRCHNLIGNALILWLL